MAQIMTVKEYAKHVDADPRTVRRWMSCGLLKFTRPKGHRARLIDSMQLRPKKKGTKSTDTVKQNIRPAVNASRQADRRPANGQADKRTLNVISQPCEKTSRLPFNPAFEKKKFESLKLKPIERKSVSSKLVSDDSDNWFWFKRLAGFFMLLWALPKLLPKILSQIRK